MSKYYRSVLNVLTPAFSSTKSMAFDGVDDFIEATKTAALTTASLSMWVKVSGTFGANERQSLASNDDFNHGRDFIIADTPTTTNDAYIAMFAGAIIYGKTSATGGIPINDGNWHHLVWTYDGSAGTSAAINMYVDGQNQYSNATYSSYWSYEIKFQYFGKPTAANTYFAGSMDEVAYFNSILSESDVTAIYNSGVPADLSSYSPTAWYRMGENGSWKSTQWLLPENSNKDKVSNYSFEFDGINDQVNLTDIPFVRAGGQSFSISAWVYCNSASQNGFFSTAVNASFAGQINLYKNGNRAAILNIVTASTGNIEIRSSNAAITSNNWHHIVATFDGTQAAAADRVNIYVNGVLDNAYQAGTGTNLPSGSSFIFNRIGRTALGVKQNGKIDNLAIWDSTLTAGNVTTLYNSGSPVDISTLSPTAGWKLGEDATFSTDWTIPDSLGSFDGTSVNMTIEDRVGEAPNSTSNSLSYNMDEADRETDVPS